MEPLTVSQLTHAIRLQLEGTFPSIRLQGEVSNAKLHSSGHFYFGLKDSAAQIAAVMFRQECSRLSRIPKDGDSVIVTAGVQVYPPMGRYQLVVKELQFAGVGELLLKLHALKMKLEQLGWFDPSLKKPLPSFPKVIGVVTSPTGAAIQDILNILTRRFSGFKLILNPVRVQGEGAALEIAKAIDDFNRYQLADVLIVGRGGGNLEDLWCFNEECVAAAIFRSKIPIISAVGHEVDNCIADCVADVRAPTPSAAAEIVIAERSKHLEWLQQTHRRLLQTLNLLIRNDRMRLNGLIRQPILQSPYTLLNFWSQRFDDTAARIEERTLFSLKEKSLQLHHAIKRLDALRPSNQIAHTRVKLRQFEHRLDTLYENKLQHWKQGLCHGTQRLDSEWRRHLENRKSAYNPTTYRQLIGDSWHRRTKKLHDNLNRHIEVLSALNPLYLLSKGYTILFSEKDNCAITSVSKLSKGCKIRLLLSDGEAFSTVDKSVAHQKSSPNVVV